MQRVDTIGKAFKICWRSSTYLTFQQKFHDRDSPHKWTSDYLFLHLNAYLTQVQSHNKTIRAHELFLEQHIALAK